MSGRSVERVELQRVATGTFDSDDDAECLQLFQARRVAVAVLFGQRGSGILLDLCAMGATFDVTDLAVAPALPIEVPGFGAIEDQ